MLRERNADAEHRGHRNDRIDHDGRDRRERQEAEPLCNELLKLQIGGKPFHLGLPTGYVAELFWSTVRSFVLLLAAVIAIWFLLRYLARPRVKKPSPSSPPSSFPHRFRRLLKRICGAVSRARRGVATRADASARARVRHALRYALGAHEKETLADLVRRNAAGDRPQRIAALRAIERACFCEDANVAGNVREALPFLTI